MNRSGQLQDNITPWIVLFLFSIVGISFILVYQEVRPGFVAAGSESGKIIDAGIVMFQNFDLAAGFILLSLFAGLIISGIFVRSHPIFFVVALIAMIFDVVAVAIIANAWEIVVGVEAFSTIVAANFQITSTIWQNAPLLSLFGIVLWGIGFYAKSRSTF